MRLGIELLDGGQWWSVRKRHIGFLDTLLVRVIPGSGFLSLIGLSGASWPRSQVGVNFSPRGATNGVCTDSVAETGNR